MGQITVNIHSRAYQVACEDGQELHVQKLAAYIDRRVAELAGRSGLPGPSGQVTESRLLVMASLLIADELSEAYDELEELRQAPPKVVSDPATIKAAEEARAAASAFRHQLTEAEAQMRAAQTRVAEAEAARRASEEAARAARDSVAALEARASEAEAVLAAANTRIAEFETQLHANDGEQDTIRATIASLTARADEAAAERDGAADGLEVLAGRIEAMAERLERAALR